MAKMYGTSQVHEETASSGSKMQIWFSRTIRCLNVELQRDYKMYYFEAYI